MGHWLLDLGYWVTPLVLVTLTEISQQQNRNHMAKTEINAMSSSNNTPLCVDLDGTLVKTDTLIESGLSAFRNPSILFRLLASLLLHGKAGFKAMAVKHSQINVALLPYNGPLLDYLKEQKRSGRTLVLATAANQNIAHRVADHLDLFDEVIASDERHNLRGATKADALANRFGPRGFSYAGNDRTDVPVWSSAQSAILVNTSGSVAQLAEKQTTIEHRIDNQTPRISVLLQALRPHHWVKNLLVFVPVVTANALGDVHAWLISAIMFLGFCATASGIYVINDICDLSADRQHLRKRFRPFASGDLSVLTGLVMGPVLVGMGLAAAYSIGVLLPLLFYTGISLAYSLKLKEMPLVDVFTLSALYTVRLLAGGMVTGYIVSLWLLAFSAFLFLSLALIKRVAELNAMITENRTIMARRGYSRNDLPILQMMGVGASLVSALVLALYVQDASITRHVNAVILWGIVPVLLFWQCRLWLSVARRYMHEDPIVYASRDWVSHLVGVTLIAIMGLSEALY